MCTCTNHVSCILIITHIHTIHAYSFKSSWIYVIIITAHAFTIATMEMSYSCSFLIRNCATSNRLTASLKSERNLRDHVRRQNTSQRTWSYKVKPPRKPPCLEPHLKYVVLKKFCCDYSVTLLGTKTEGSVGIVLPKHGNFYTITSFKVDCIC